MDTGRRTRTVPPSGLAPAGRPEPVGRRTPRRAAGGVAAGGVAAASRSRATGARRTKPVGAAPPADGARRTAPGGGVRGARCGAARGAALRAAGARGGRAAGRSAPGWRARARSPRGRACRAADCRTRCTERWAAAGAAAAPRPPRRRACWPSSARSGTATRNRTRAVARGARRWRCIGDSFVTGQWQKAKSQRIAQHLSCQMRGGPISVPRHARRRPPLVRFGGQCHVVRPASLCQPFGYGPQ